ncbi:hypothetical protein QUF95_15395 [Paenibacillus silvae]|uniref:hypothetical protein n=1 Tax=Paenibacillus silvae TaxID=1325358 RepID=UPI0025A0A2F4|nr:hypothetical protein [Paenibacillus silvae]MDM5278782.1 hypothetical protein [Paenibacillus silvae]
MTSINEELKSKIDQMTDRQAKMTLYFLSGAYAAHDNKKETDLFNYLLGEAIDSEIRLSSST